MGRQGGKKDFKVKSYATEPYQHIIISCRLTVHFNNLGGEYESLITE